MYDTAMLPSTGKGVLHSLSFQVPEVTFPEQYKQSHQTARSKQATQADEYLPDMEMGWDVSGSQFSLNSSFLMGLHGCRDCLDAKHTPIFRKYSPLNVHIIFFLNQNDKSWGAAQKLRETVCHFICTKILYETPQVLPVPKNLQITQKVNSM